MAAPSQSTGCWGPVAGVCGTSSSQLPCCPHVGDWQAGANISQFWWDSTNLRLFSHIFLILLPLFSTRGTGKRTADQKGAGEAPTQLVSVLLGFKKRFYWIYLFMFAEITGIDVTISILCGAGYQISGFVHARPALWHPQPSSRVLFFFS